ncbi:hypothetical protein [Methylomonas methanica]|uniref:hypothetical protein n=1 Tax=Methylomonas methanica TaxID=421 RepID=UPI0009DAF7C5|nr:hypothetical protein [Methylomonas methanica]
MLQSATHASDLRTNTRSKTVAITWPVFTGLNTCFLILSVYFLVDISTNSTDIGLLKPLDLAEGASREAFIFILFIETKGEKKGLTISSKSLLLSGSGGRI